MTEAEIRRAFLEELVRVAPDIDPDAVAPQDHLQDDLELDSMDFLNLVMALHNRLGVAVPEADYPKIATLEKAMAYFLARLSAGACLPDSA